jgi:hypothetical protein
LIFTTPETFLTSCRNSVQQLIQVQVALAGRISSPAVHFQRSFGAGQTFKRIGQQNAYTQQLQQGQNRYQHSGKALRIKSQPFGSRRRY